MKRYLAFIILVIILIHCNPEKLLKEDKQPPDAGQIECDDADGDFKFEPGTIHKFWITANDPEGDILYYEWQATGGELIGRTNSDTVQWQLPSIQVFASMGAKLA